MELSPYYFEYESSIAAIEFDVSDLKDFPAQEFQRLLRDDFPLPIISTNVPANALPPIPRFVMQSKFAKLEVGKDRVALNVNYLGNHKKDYKLCDEYLHKKIDRIYQVTVDTLKANVKFFGNVTNIKYSFSDSSINGAIYLQDIFASQKCSDNVLNDYNVKYTIKHKDRYFVSVSLSNYERYMISISQKTGIPTMEKPLKLKLSDMSISDTGIQIVFDINNKLSLLKSEAVISIEDIYKILDITKDMCDRDKVINLMKGNIEVKQ